LEGDKRYINPLDQNIPIGIFIKKRYSLE